MGNCFTDDRDGGGAGLCLTPRKVWLLKGPKYEAQEVACGKCWQCRAHRQSDYVGRCLCEAAVSEWVWVLTLTYRDAGDDLSDRQDGDHLDRVRLNKEHVQRMWKNLRAGGRKKINRSIRYLVVGEYGERKGRAHWHALVFGKGDELPGLEHGKRVNVDWWPHGHVYAERCRSEKAVRYVTKYIGKDVDKPESDGVASAVMMFSKVPALGSEWLMARAERMAEKGVMPRNFTYTPPGGSLGKTYLLRGVVKRRFAQRVRDLIANKKMLERISEVVRRQLEVADRQDAEKRALAETWERLKEQYTETAASREARKQIAQRAVYRWATDVQGDVTSSEAKELLIWARDVGDASDAGLSAKLTRLRAARERKAELTRSARARRTERERLLAGNPREWRMALSALEYGERESRWRRSLESSFSSGPSSGSMMTCAGERGRASERSRT